MTTVSLPMEGLTVGQLLQEAERSDVVFLTANGQVRFALVAAEDEDVEIASLRSNPAFMTFLSECEERARTRPRKTLEQMRQLYGSDSAVDPPTKQP